MKTPKLYLLAAALFVLGAALFLCSRSLHATHLLKELHIHPSMAAKLCAAGLVLALLLAGSSPLRETVHRVVGAGWRWLTEERENPTTQKDGWALLAGLRFVLASIVIIFHVNFLCFGMATGHWTYALSMAGGFAAVMGFFLISGYSIAASVGREKGGFLRRRFWRIFPLFWSAFLLACVPFLVWGPHIREGAGVVLNAPTNPWAYVGNALCLQTAIFDPLVTFKPSWSLFAEVFYYALALLFIRCSKLEILALIGASIAWWFISYQASGATTLAWAWLLGFALYRFRSQRLFIVLALVAPAFMLATCNYDVAFRGSLGWATVVITSIALVAAPYVKIGDKWKSRLNWAGDVSYPLYLTHWPIYAGLYPVLFLIYGPAFKSTWLTPIVFLAIVVPAAVAFYYLIDLPVRRWSASRSTKAKEALATT